MLIRTPIFLNCFSRGGSNIFWNLFLSHPGACSPIEETLTIFRLGWRRPTLAGLWLAVVSQQPGFFDQWRLQDRRDLTAAAARFVDRTLFSWKMRTVSDIDMKFKFEGVTYAEGEVRASRLVAKHNNGLSFLVKPLLALYPDATFFSLVRHPLPLFESYARRGIINDPAHFARFYSRLATRMLDDVDQLECCHLVRFEDILNDPVEVTQRVYRLAGLDFLSLRGLRFKAKSHFRADGTYGTDRERNRHHWIALANAKAFLEPDVNNVQRERVVPTQAEVVMKRTGAVRRRLGYD